MPGQKYDLSALEAVMLAGSPVSAECGAWFYRNVKPDLWLCTGSGGTDICSGFVGGMPTLPVYAGEIQARHLGVSAFAFNEAGEPVTGQVGEMVITQPMPSMPVCLWNDDGDELYLRDVFADFPGVWRQGDFFKVNERGGCFVLGQRRDLNLWRPHRHRGDLRRARVRRGGRGRADLNLACPAAVSSCRCSSR